MRYLVWLALVAGERSEFEVLQHILVCVFFGLESGLAFFLTSFACYMYFGTCLDNKCEVSAWSLWHSALGLSEGLVGRLFCISSIVSVVVGGGGEGGGGGGLVVVMCMCICITEEYSVSAHFVVCSVVLGCEAVVIR